MADLPDWLGGRQFACVTFSPGMAFMEAVDDDAVCVGDAAADGATVLP